MTADGTDDHLIKLEGVPKDEKFTFMEEPTTVEFGWGELLGAEAEGEMAIEAEPDDLAPEREEGDGNGLELDEEDEEDEDEQDA